LASAWWPANGCRKVEPAVLKTSPIPEMNFLLIRRNSGVLIYQETNLTANKATLFYSGSKMGNKCQTLHFHLIVGLKRAKRNKSQSEDLLG